MNLKSNHAPADERVDLSKLEEVEYWCRKLGCTPFDLRKIVMESGGKVKDLEAYSIKKTA